MVKTTTTAEQTAERPDPKYKGVRKRKWGKWVSEIRLPNSRERIWLGSYDTPQKAARAFDAALFCLRGPDAKFNFPENPPSAITGPGGEPASSLVPQEIRVAAARFANLDPPRNNNNNNCTSSSSEGGGAVHVESDTTIDWSFLDMLDSNEAASDFGLYSGIEYHMNMNLTSDEFFSPSPLPADDGEDQNGFPQTSSFLWNF